MKPDQAESLRKKMRERQMIKPELYVKKAKTLAVISGKGGVGKSNLTLNMAVALQEKGKKHSSLILTSEWATLMC